MTALASGSQLGTLFGASDLKARGRSHLRRGLFVSGALHLALLASLLPLWSGGSGDVVLRTIRGEVRVLPAPPPLALAPFEQTETSARVVDRGAGIFDPVIHVPPPRLDVGPFGADRLGPVAGDPGTGTPSGAPPHGAAGTATEPGDPIYESFDEAPVPLFAPKPEYPEWAREAGVTGRVLLRVLVGSDGRVRRVEVQEGVRGLSESARDGVARWVFRPAKANGKPVSVWVALPVVFRL